MSRYSTVIVAGCNQLVPILQASAGEVMYSGAEASNYLSTNPVGPIIAVVQLSADSSYVNQILDQLSTLKKDSRQVVILGVLLWQELNSGEVHDEELQLVDDLLMFPAPPRELEIRLARLRNLFKESRVELATELNVGPFVFDLKTLRVCVRDKVVRLTHKEAELLLFIANRANSVVTRTMLAREIWNAPDTSPCFESVLNGHISRIREKLADVGCRGLLKTVRGEGFMLVTQIASTRSPMSAVARPHRQVLSRPYSTEVLMHFDAQI